MCLDAIARDTLAVGTKNQMEAEHLFRHNIFLENN